MYHRRLSVSILAFTFVAACDADVLLAVPSTRGTPSGGSAFKNFIESHCLDCHDTATATANLALEDLIVEDIGRSPEAWEKVVRKLSTGQMPPSEMPRPEAEEYESALAWLTSSLDQSAAMRPNPGRTETFRRLTRMEYKHAIWDLLEIDVDVVSLLPPDESSRGFDNITVSDLSPALFNRYLMAAQKISQMAVGAAQPAPREEVFRVRPDITQDVHLEGLPIGTRGGAAFEYNFPQDGEYEIQVRLMRDRNDELESLATSHELEVLLDRERVEVFTVKPPRGGATHHNADAHLKTRFAVKAGPHHVGVAFLQKSASLSETTRQPLNVHFNFYRHPRIGPAVHQVSVRGPFGARGPGDTPSRSRIFICRPAEAGEEEGCAKRILAHFLRRAYRQPIGDEELKTPLEFYRAGREEGGFEAGIEMALSSILVNPQFLFRIEHDPPDVPAGTAYAIDDVALASRLSFFLWSSIPDDELLTLAEKGVLHRAGVLEQQVRRMLADTRADALIKNFARQWLYLQNLESVNPDMRKHHARRP
jgi:hypothetical protein